MRGAWKLEILFHKKQVNDSFSLKYHKITGESIHHPHHHEGLNTGSAHYSWMARHTLNLRRPSILGMTLQSNEINPYGRNQVFQKAEQSSKY